MRYLCIDRRRYRYPIRVMCEALQVSLSGYYAWRMGPESHRDNTDRTLTQTIRRIHRESKGIYGSPKIPAELNVQGYHHVRHKIARLMRLAGLNGCSSTTL